MSTRAAGAMSVVAPALACEIGVFNASSAPGTAAKLQPSSPRKSRKRSGESNAAVSGSSASPSCSTRTSRTSSSSAMASGRGEVQRIRLRQLFDRRVRLAGDRVEVVDQEAGRRIDDGQQDRVFDARAARLEL